MSNQQYHLSLKIREARIKAGLSQVKIAKALHMARQTYLDLEAGRNNPRISTLADIAEVTDCSLLWFIFPMLSDLEEAQEYERFLAQITELPNSVRHGFMHQQCEALKALQDNYK